MIPQTFYKVSVRVEVPPTQITKVLYNDPLKMAEKSGIDLHIGGVHVAATSCADDIILPSYNSYSQQCLLNLAKGMQIKNVMICTHKRLLL